jgi:hypothetical protein
MRFMDWVRLCYGNADRNQSIGGAMVISYLWIMLLPKSAYLVPIVGVLYCLSPYSPNFGLIKEKDVKNGA